MAEIQFTDEMKIQDGEGNPLTSTDVGGKQSLDVNVAGGHVTIDAGDIEIGAVEIKDATSDKRVVVEEVNGKNSLRIAEQDPLFLKKVTQPLFNSEDLTDTWAPSLGVACENYGQAVVFISYAKGSEDKIEFKFQYSPDGSNWFDDVYGVLGNPIAMVVKVYESDISCEYRLSLSLSDSKVRLLVRGVGTLITGAVSATLMLGWN